MFVSQNDGQALHDYLVAQPNAQVQVQLTSTSYTFNVPDTLSCEFVGVRVQTDHSSRGDLQIVLIRTRSSREETFPRCREVGWLS